MGKRAWWIAAACLLTACTKANPSASCANGVCTDPKYPYCDQDGSIGGEPNACISVTCTPGEFRACNGDSLVTCNAGGDGYTASICAAGCNEATKACNACAPNTARCFGAMLETCGSDGNLASTETCSLSCKDAPSAHCEYLQPRYLPDVCDAVATAPLLNVTNSGTFDVDLDTNCTGGVVTQAGGPPICVVRYASIKVGTSAILSVFSSMNQSGGTAGRALAFVADSDVTVAGEIDANATLIGYGAVNGPGGGTNASGGATSYLSGGGGAGFKTVGGAGGTASADGGAGNGGAATSDPALLTAFIGGPMAGSGGGGGGALMLVACRGSVTVSGTIGANGGGGPAGYSASGNTSHAGGYGGGAGGYVVIQGLRASVTGSVYANGGAGAAGAPNLIGSGTDGANGTNTDAVPASGATSAGAGSGGNGGYKGGAPGNGLKPTTSGAAAGGGGGSVGFLQVYTPQNVSPTVTPAHASPSFQPNATVQTR